jgi:hypothetical protein
LCKSFLCKSKAFYFFDGKEYPADVSSVSFKKVEGTILTKGTQPPSNETIDGYHLTIVKHSPKVCVPGKVKVGSRQSYYGYGG